MKISLSDKAILLVLQKILNYGMQIIRTFLFVRLFTQEVYGSFRQLLMLSGFLTPVFILSLPVGLLYFIPITSDVLQKRRIMSQTIFSLTFSALVCLIILLLTKEYIAQYFHNPHLSLFITIYSLSICFIISSTYFPELMYSYEKVMTAFFLKSYFKSYI